MKVTQTVTAERIEILANDHFVGVPVKISTTPMKAGTPITATGTVATGDDARGILLYDVTENNPNGTMVVHGFIETVKAEALSGVTVTETMKSAMPMVKFN